MRQWTDHPLNLGHGIQKKKQSVMKMMTQKKKLLVAGSGGP
jgi:hypothetical protein